MLRKILLPHMAAAIITSALLLLTYGSVQQVYRMYANDPQMQVAQELAYRVSQDKPVAQELANDDTIELEQCPGQFIQLYDGSGNLLQSTGRIGRLIPKIPEGVLQEAKAYGHNEVTWQPARTVRLAVAVVYTGGVHPGYVVAARSLWETERRIGNLLTMSALCWIACIGVIGAHGLLQGYFERKRAI